MPIHREPPRSERAHQQPESPLRLQDFSVTELTEALGCPRANAMEVTRALVDLCKTAAIRFGVPPASRETIRKLIDAPDNSMLLVKTNDISSDPRWERLASCVVPPVDGGFPVASLRAPSSSALEGLKEAVALFKAEIEALRLKPISERNATLLKDSIEKLRQEARHDKDWKNEKFPACRQLTLFHKVGPQWALVSTFERLFLSRCVAPEESPQPTTQTTHTSTAKVPGLNRKDRSSQPDAKLLAPFKLTWVFSQKTKTWGPSTYGSKYKNSTLFDLPAKYLTTLFRNPLHERVKVFVEALLTARRTYEETRGRDASTAVLKLREAQKEALRDMLRT